MSIRVADLSRRFAGPPEHLALDRLDLTVADGEFLCLVGPSGSGKTTLLRILGGLDRGFSGKLMLPPGLRPAIVFQEPRLMPWLTVLDNLLLVASSRDKTAESQARALLEEVDVADFADAYPGQLSGGMQRRAALARALLVAPDLMLLDEPFVSLDVPTAEHLRQLVTRLWRSRHTTSIFVTHDLREAMALGTRILFLTRSPGRAALDWRPDLPLPGERSALQTDAAVRSLQLRYPRLLEGEAEADLPP